MDRCGLFFAQVSVEVQLVDLKPTCGNILSGVGPAAIEMGLVAAQDGETPVNFRAVNTEARFASSDIVSVHARLKPETRGHTTAADLAQMQPRAHFVNTSRSGLVEAASLEAEVAKGGLHAAVNVFEHEPLTDTSNILLTHPNVLATAHIGFVTEDEFDLQFSDTFDQINAFAAGAPIHMSNPEVYP